MSETTLDIIDEQDQDPNQMTWQVLDVNLKEDKKSRKLKGDTEQKTLEIDSMRIQL